MKERTLIVAKPDAVKRKLVGQVLSRFESKGFDIVDLKLVMFDEEMAKKFYDIHSSKPFFQELVSFITSGKVVAAIIEGENAIATTRIMVGSTKSFEAAPGSIRGDFGLGLTDNIIHASDSKESFEKESSIIFANK